MCVCVCVCVCVHLKKKICLVFWGCLYDLFSFSSGLILHFSTLFSIFSAYKSTLHYDTNHSIDSLKFSFFVFKEHESMKIHNTSVAKHPQTQLNLPFFNFLKFIIHSMKYKQSMHITHRQFIQEGHHAVSVSSNERMYCFHKCFLKSHTI